MSMLVPFGIPAWVKIVNTGKLSVTCLCCNLKCQLWHGTSFLLVYSFSSSSSSSSLLSNYSPCNNSGNNQLELHPGTSIRSSKSNGERQQQQQMAGRQELGWKVSMIHNDVTSVWGWILKWLNTAFSLSIAWHIAFLSIFACRLLVTAPVTRGLSRTVPTPCPSNLTWGPSHRACHKSDPQVFPCSYFLIYWANKFIKNKILKAIDKAHLLAMIKQKVQVYIV